MSDNIIKKNLSYLSLLNQNGETVNIGNFSGKFILLWWFPKADTPGWTIEGKGFRDRILEFKQKEIVIFGVSGDLPSENKSFKDKYTFPFDVLSDLELKETKKIGLCKMEDTFAPRVTLILDRKGFVIDHYDNVDPKTHALDILTSFKD